MYRDYTIVAVTAAGRRRYMQYLVPFVVASDVVDRYDIWINTHNGADIEFFKQLAKKFPKVNLVWQPDGIVNGISTINAFYKGCTDPDSIYFKLDDDIPWMEPDLIKKMVDFRIDNPEYFLVSPLVINNNIGTYLMQVCGKINLRKYHNSPIINNEINSKGELCAQLHDWFIESKLKPGRWEDLYLGSHPLGIVRFSINAILWFGKDLKAIEGIIPGDDEEFLSCIYPAQIGKANCYNGDAVLAHFAFYSQREVLDCMGVLERYGAYNDSTWQKDPKMAPIHKVVQDIMTDVENNEEKLMTSPSPYRRPEVKPLPPLSIKTRAANFFIKHLPSLYAGIKKHFAPEPPEQLF